MQTQTQAPTEIAADGDTVTFRHPAYALIHANRIEGGAVLFGSDFQHQRFVRIRIVPAELQRSLSQDMVTPAGMRHIEVDMSEAQWASFVSSVGVGQGVACTLFSHNGQPVPGLPAPVDRQAQFSGELEKCMADANRDLAALDQALKASGLSKTKQAELLSLLDAARSAIGERAELVAEAFGEHMEHNVAQARSEVNAYIHAAGLGPVALAQGQPPQALPGKRQTK